MIQTNKQTLVWTWDWAPETVKKVWLLERGSQKAISGGYDQQLQIHGVFHFINEILIILELERQKEEVVCYSRRSEIQAKS